VAASIIDKLPVFHLTCPPPSSRAAIAVPGSAFHPKTLHQIAALAQLDLLTGPSAASAARYHYAPTPQRHLATLHDKNTDTLTKSYLPPLEYSMGIGEGCLQGGGEPRLPRLLANAGQVSSITVPAVR
jgi:hypothetical protein